MSITVPSELLPEKTGFERLALDAVENAHSRLGMEIWNSLRGTRRFPSRLDLKPREIAHIMQYMSLIKVIDGGKDFENRFVGDAVVRAHDVPIAGRRFSSVAYDAPVLIEGLTPLLQQIVATGEPLAYRGKTGHDMEHVVYTDFEGVMLPLGETDAAVDHVLYVGACSVHVAPSWRR